jgi:signal transduction histidine kinase
VSDTGVSIAPEDREAAFEEFRQVGTADKKVEGTGLRLALSRKFIELHGGKIWVQESGGAGLDVHVYDSGTAAQMRAL